LKRDLSTVNCICGSWIWKPDGSRSNGGLVRTGELLERGEIPADSFLRPDRYGMQLPVRNLFLPACSDAPADEPECESKRTADWRFRPVMWPR